MITRGPEGRARPRSWPWWASGLGQGAPWPEWSLSFLAAPLGTWVPLRPPSAAVQSGVGWATLAGGRDCSGDPVIPGMRPGDKRPSNTCFLQRELRPVENGHAWQRSPASGQGGLSVSRTAGQQGQVDPTVQALAVPTLPRGALPLGIETWVPRWVLRSHHWSPDVWSRSGSPSSAWTRRGPDWGPSVSSRG